MRSRWPGKVLQGFVIALLVFLILGITTATLMPVIYKTDWFQNKFVKTPR